MAGLTRRAPYKPDRPSARKKGVLYGQAPVALPDAAPKEIAMALASLCDSADVVPGQGGMYDPLRDEYTVIGKSKETGKAQDFKVQGFEVAVLIGFLRQLNGGRFDQHAITRAFGERPGV